MGLNYDWCDGHQRQLTISLIRSLYFLKLCKKRVWWWPSPQHLEWYTS